MSRILFIRGGALGDFLLTLPAIELVSKELPAAAVHTLGYKPHVDLALKFGLAVETRSMEHGPMSEMFIPGRGATARWKDWFASFSVVVSHLSDPDGVFAENLRLAGVKTLLAGPSRVDSKGTHAAFQLARPLESIGLYLDRPWVEFPRAEAAPHRILIHPGSGGQRKNWSVENWISLIAEWHEQQPEIEFGLITGEVEAENGTAKKIRHGLTDLPCEFIENRPLAEVADHLSRARAFLGHDSGISHLAAVYGIPSLLLFGPTNPEVWAPKHPAVRTLQAPEDDLQRLSVSAVLDHGKKLLKADGHS